MSLVGVAIDVSSECRGTFVLICHTISQLCTSHAEYSSRMSSLHSKKAVACMRYTKSSFLKTCGLDRAPRPASAARAAERARACTPEVLTTPL